MVCFVLKFQETGVNQCAYMDIDAIYFQLLLLLKQGKVSITNDWQLLNSSMLLLFIPM